MKLWTKTEIVGGMESVIVWWILKAILISVENCSVQRLDFVILHITVDSDYIKIQRKVVNIMKIECKLRIQYVHVQLDLHATYSSS